MVTSTTAVYQLTRDKIVRKAAELCNIAAAGEALSAELTVSAVESLNLMLKTFQTLGLRLFTTQQITVFLAKTSQSYLLGPSGDYASATSVTTTTTADHAIAATTIAVTSSAGMTAGDVIGVEVADNELHWTTISSVPGATSVIIASGLATASSSGAAVYSYTTLPQKPERVYGGMLRNSSGTDIPVSVMARTEWESLSSKSSTGRILQVYYDVNGVSANGRLYVWNVTSTETDRLLLTVQRPLYVFTASNETVDMPDHWQEAVVWGLAWRMGMTNSIPLQNVGVLRSEAERLLKDAKNYDIEPASVFMQFDGE